MTPEVHDLLVEIGTEELPPKSLNALAQDLAQNLKSELTAKHLSFGTSAHFASPRRLAVILRDLPIKQADRVINRKGPAVTAAYDDNDQPTPALLGFARSCGCEVDALTTEKTAKGEWLYYQHTQTGMATTTLLAEIAQTALTKLPITRPMRWGSSANEFVRPIHWAVLLFGNQLVKANILGVDTGVETYGHRFHHPEPLALGLADDYEFLLQKEAFVIADFNQRKTLIRSQIEKLGAQKGRTVIDPDLLDEVTGLVEWPVALMANFDPEFLDVPSETLISAMQQHQKCFPIVDGEGRLLPHFITVSNIESKNPERVIAGNERVMRARLADAAFFYHSDLKTPLAARVDKLKPIVFHHKLGSVYDKTQRVKILCKAMAPLLEADINIVEKIADLAKTDLVTQMVEEFPELQGIMGYYYAIQDKTLPQDARKQIACALKEQYQPRFAGGELPESVYGAIIAIADRLDTIVGLFGINCPPTGEKDPFGLRRAALGLIRIMIEKALPLDLSKLIETSITTYQEKIKNPNTATEVFAFIFERLKSYYLDQDINTNVFASVLKVKPTQPLDFDQRIKAVCEFEFLPQAQNLAAANKRVSNIIRKLADDYHIPDEVNTQLLTETAEQNLAKLIAEKHDEVKQLASMADYTQALTTLASLQQPVDQFFDEVLVMTNDEALQKNRLALLNQLRQLFLYVADISQL